MPAGITERAVIDLIGMEDCMDGLSDTADVSEEGIAFVIGQFRQLALDRKSVV